MLVLVLIGFIGFNHEKKNSLGRLFSNITKIKCTLQYLGSCIIFISTSRFITTREPIEFFTNLLECLFLTGLYLDFIFQYRNLGMSQKKKMQNVNAKITQPKTD